MILTAISAFCFLVFTVLFCGVKFLSLNIFGKSVCKIKNPPKDTVYLTFDDGPHPDITPKVLDLLKKYDQKATFFCIAQRAKNYPEIVKKIVQDGHTLASHDLRHHWTSNFRRTKQMTQEIGESVRILEEISQTKIKFYRPPVGLSNPHLFAALKKLNLQCVGWSKSANDGGNRFVCAIKKIPALADKVKNGDIILLHDAAEPPSESGIGEAARYESSDPIEEATRRGECASTEKGRLFLQNLEILLSRLCQKSKVSGALDTADFEKK